MERGSSIPAKDVLEFLVRECDISARKVSLAMGMNERYVATAIGRGKDVQTSTLARICEDGTAGALSPAHLYIEDGGRQHRIEP